MINEESGKLNAAIAKNASAIVTLEATADKIDADVARILADINTVNESIKDLKSELEGKISTLRNEYEAFVASTNDDISEIKSLIETIKTQIETLHSNSDSFAEKYQAATDELYNGEYSIDNFNAMAAQIKSEDYEESVYKDFEEAVERLRFFLNRAISVDAIEGYFEELNGIIDGMPTLVQSLTEMLNKYTDNAPEGERKYLTADEHELDSINRVYNKIGSVEDELKALYDDIVAAHNNLTDAAKAAKDIENDIGNIAAPIVYTKSEPAIVYAEIAFENFSTTYFVNDEMNKYYGETGADDLVTNYGKLTEYRARYDVLTEAATNKAVFEAVVLNYETARPLWKDLAIITADVAEYEAWLVTYDIKENVDADTIANIYADELVLLEKAEAYAAYMSGVYTDKGVEALVAQIGEYVGSAEILYNTKDTCDAFNAAREDIKAAVEAATDYAADDKNYTEMFGEELLTKLAEATARIEKLVEAKAKIDAVYAEMDAMLNKEGGITYDDSETISNFKPTLEKIYEDYAISSEKDPEGNYVDQNFADLASAAESKYAELIVAYKAVIEEVVNLISTIDNTLTQIKWLLKDGKQIQGIVNDLSRFIFEYEVTNVDLWLPDEDMDVEVDLSELLKKYNTAAANYKIQAMAAEAAAASVNETIANLMNVNANDIKNNAIVLKAYADFEAWVTEHLTADVEAVGSVAGAIDEIQGVAVFGAKDTYYSFVTVENYKAVVEAYNTAVTAMENAETEWNAISTDMASLVAAWDIHSYEDKDVNFLAVKAAYDEYVEKYYDGVIDVDTDVFGELDDDGVPAFEEAMEKCKMALDNAGDAADAINAKIEGLEAVTTDNAADILLLIAEIENDIANYEQTYCADGCKFGNNLFKLYQTKMYAEFANAVNDAYAYADTAEEIGELNNRLATAEQYIMQNSTTKKMVDNAYGLLKDELDEYVAALNA